MKIEYNGYGFFKSYPLFLNKDGNKYEKRRLLAFPLIGLAMLGMMSCGEEKTSDTLSPIQRPTTTPVQSSTIEEPEGVKLSNITIDDTKMKKHIMKVKILILQV